VSEIDRLLAETSRTFALSIPMLSEPLRSQVSVSYLLFRIADTLEDEAVISPEERAAALELVAAAADEPTSFASTLGDALSGFGTPTDHPGYARLMDNTGVVLDAFGGLSPDAQRAIAGHLGKTCRGMGQHLRSGSTPETIEELKAYCYTVAGIVGDLLTELFLMAKPIDGKHAERLKEISPLFGEALQLVNILRDERDDAACERRYLPAEADRGELIAIAASDLHAAGIYVGMLESGGADTGTVAFNGLNAMLAVETLALVREHGAGVKLSRADVTRLFDSVRDAAGSGRVSAMILSSLGAVGLLRGDAAGAARR
jgi:farnesyl-diphosphate farnesyltransferase